MSGRCSAKDDAGKFRGIAGLRDRRGRLACKADVRKMGGGFFTRPCIMPTTALPSDSIQPNTTPRLDPLLSLKRILGNNERAGLLEISRSSFYELIQAGIIPRPIKIGTRSLWRQSDIQRAIERLAGGECKLHLG